MSERRLAQAGRGRGALHASDEQFRGMIENAPVPIFINRDDRIHFINRAGIQLLRAQSPQQLLGQSVYDIFHPEVHERMRSRIAALRERPGNSVPAVEERVVTLDGAAVEVEVAAMSYRVDGHLDIQVVVRDVTELRRAEREIRELNATLERRVAERTRELDQANRAKSDFLANMSHELRTPLNSIIGFSEMLRDGILGDLEARQREFVDDIFDAGTHLLALINDILDLSKVEAGMLQLETDAVDIAALFRSSTLVVREKAAASRIRVDTQLESGLASLAADERKLKQILYNLLSNAVKFTSPGGAVSLRARRCTRAEVALDNAMPGRLLPLPSGDDEEFLAITVEDSGAGIAAENLARLFEPFTQVDSSVARRHAGTGLGLSLVRRLAELHAGTVAVESRLGAGSRFHVWLPYREADALTIPTLPGPGAATRAEPALPLALVVEDDDRMAERIAVQLRADGFRVMRAATGEEALVRAAKSRPQLITLDIFLPAMDGWEFMRRLKSDPRLADTPVVIITVADDPERGLALGARRVLQKPLVHEDLIAALAGIVDRVPGGGQPRVLVVDDNVRTVDMVATRLEAEGYRVIRAYGGAEAIAAAHREAPDVAILDLVMPDVNGFDVARALRDAEATAGIPILVLTGKELTAEERAYMHGTVSAIVAKSPAGHRTLLTELRRALPRRSRN